MSKSSRLLALGVTSAFIASIALHLPTVYAATMVVTNTNDSGPGSLRQAILDTNATVDADTINFSIGSGLVTISPTSPLPPITRPVTIDGSSQPGFTATPLIEISGSSAGANARGLYISGNGATSTIKSLIINRFSAQGIFIDTNNVTITGNYVGTNATGSAGAGNSGDGVAIFSGTSVASANSNTIGGTTASDRNIISGNGGNGIGLTAQVGGNTSNNVIAGNYVGTNAAGTGAIANGGDGILINHADGGGPANATGNVIGGTSGTTADGACTGACNLVSGNIANGIGLWHGGVSGTTVFGNYVGTNAAGTGAIANGNIGIEVNEAPNNTVGGTTPAARNLFSGNGGSGVFLTGAAATGNVVQGNYIGTNSAGTAGIGNIKMGLGIGASPGAVGANSNTIGGTTGVTPGGACTGACNLLSGNGENGIFITGSESFGHIIIGNYIGTNAAGTGSIGNVLDGIGVLSTPNTQIGAVGNGSNVISGNGSNGIIVVGGASTGNQIKGNIIGMSSSGTSLGNTGSGVAISSANYTQILANSIAFNGRLGIDLDNNGSVNQNDPGDSDNSANHLQNFPVIYAARNVGGSTKIGGQFNGEPNSSFQIDFYYSDGCNASYPNNYGEGQHYISSITISTDSFGNTAFGATTPSQIAGNKYITATATKRINGAPAETSEFSQCILVNAAKPALTNGATWFLKYDLTTGPADKTFGYGFPSYLLLCAWDPNQPGVKLPVIFSGGAWYMRASYTTGTADNTFGYGGSSSDVRPVCGDWDGDGTDGVGVVTGNNTWLLRNTSTSGAADAGNFQFGSFPAKPVVGDWDGDDTDTIGVVDSGNNWSLRNTNTAGSADMSFNYGFTPGYQVVGDWDGNGTDTIGSVSTGGTWSLRSSNSAGPANGSFQYGFPGVVPLVW